jgi:hypothetical protein
MKIKNLLFALAVMLVCSLSISAQTSTAYSNIETGVNAGDHSWVTFYFGHPVNGEPGTTELIVQCGLHRAELITNADVYGEQKVSQFFAVTCTQSPTTIVNGNPTTTFTLNSTPLFESLVMYPGYWGGPTQSLNLTITGATWTFSGSCGFGRCSGPGTTGRANIEY